MFREGSDLDLDRSFLRQRREGGAEAFLGEQRGEEPVTDLAQPRQCSTELGLSLFELRHDRSVGSGAEAGAGEPELH